MLLADILAQTSADAVRSGLGFGSVLAIVCSWDRNRSILLAIIAGVFSWLYVIYFALTRQPGDRIGRGKDGLEAREIQPLCERVLMR